MHHSKNLYAQQGKRILTNNELIIILEKKRMIKAIGYIEQRVSETELG